MKYQQIVILLPCHSLEDFPLHHEQDEAQGLLANWTAMWHPALIDSAGAMPAWARIDDPPEELSGRLLLVPSVSVAEIPAGFASRAKSEGAVVIRRGQDRQEILAEALGHLDAPSDIDAELVADFLALGYCYLQVQLLTRQMRYASNLDEIYFDKQVVAAAAAAVAGDAVRSRELLGSCFDVLGEERDHFYPVDAYLIDLTLVADTTVGESLRQELSPAIAPQKTSSDRTEHSGDVPSNVINLLMSGETLVAMAEKEPQTLALLKEALQKKSATIVGGEHHEGKSLLCDQETMLAELKHGLDDYLRLLDMRPNVFGRRRFGLSPVLPQILAKTGFTAALHTTLDGGQFPDGAQTKTTWEGGDGTKLPALARPPLDASLPETFLSLCMKMGESMDSDHVATLCFAHWPQQACSWYDDLRRAVGWGPALGKFISIEEYFAKTDDGGMEDRFQADFYRSPYLKQAVIRSEKNPLSSWVRYYRSQAAHAAGAALGTVTSLLTGESLEIPANEQAGEMGAATDESDCSSAVEAFAAALPRASGSKEKGVLVVNPYSFVRRMTVDVGELERLPTVEKPVYAAGESHGRKHAVVDVPPLGFAWLTAGSAGKPQKPLVEDDALRNEFFEIRFDETTGAIRSLHDYANRANRLSQQLALRTPTKSGGASYSVMACDSIDVTAANAAIGEFTTRGRLLDTEGKKQAAFVQVFRAVRGSRVLQVEIEITPEAELRADPWNSYYCFRLAWADEAADLYRSVGGIRERTGSRRLEAPLFVEIETPKQRNTLFTGGLPFHRRSGSRMLDTLLMVRGEETNRFKLGIGIDVAYPLQEALSLIAPTTAITQDNSPPSGASSSWLFHIDSKNVVATHWQPLVEEGRVAGFRVRLLEAYGRPGKVKLSCYRNVQSARKVDFQGSPIADCEVSGDRVLLDVAAREWLELEVR